MSTIVEASTRRVWTTGLRELQIPPTCLNGNRSSQYIKYKVVDSIRAVELDIVIRIVTNQPILLNGLGNCILIPMHALQSVQLVQQFLEQ